MNCGTYTIPGLKRLPAYLRLLRKWRSEGRLVASSEALAKASSVGSIVVRKDLEMAGVSGRSGVGYGIDELIDRVECFLGWKENVAGAFLVGPEGFGRALLECGNLSEYGLRIVAGFDFGSPHPRGRMIRNTPIFDFEAEFANLVRLLRVRLGILCVADDEAQAVAEKMVAAGISAIWNFTEHTLELPEHIIRQKVNLAGDMAVLSKKLLEKWKAATQHSAGAEAAADPASGAGT